MERKAGETVIAVSSMSADIVNLRLARKQKARAERERVAEGNRLRFGRSASERKQSAAIKDLETRALDGKRRPPEQRPDDPDDSISS